MTDTRKKCNCDDWIAAWPQPGKVIILRCSICATEYTLYPNGDIAYEQRTDGAVSTGA